MEEIYDDYYGISYKKKEKPLSSSQKKRYERILKSLDKNKFLSIGNSLSSMTNVNIEDIEYEISNSKKLDVSSICFDIEENNKNIRNINIINLPKFKEKESSSNNKEWEKYNTCFKKTNSTKNKEEKQDKNDEKLMDVKIRSLEKVLMANTLGKILSSSFSDCLNNLLTATPPIYYSCSSEIKMEYTDKSCKCKKSISSIDFDKI